MKNYLVLSNDVQIPFILHPWKGNLESGKVYSNINELILKSAQQKEPL